MPVVAHLVWRNIRLLTTHRSCPYRILLTLWTSFNASLSCFAYRYGVLCRAAALLALNRYLLVTVLSHLHGPCEQPPAPATHLPPFARDTRAASPTAHYRQNRANVAAPTGERACYRARRTFTAPGKTFAARRDLACRGYHRAALHTTAQRRPRTTCTFPARTRPALRFVRLQHHAPTTTMVATRTVCTLPRTRCHCGTAFLLPATAPTPPHTPTYTILSHLAPHTFPTRLQRAALPSLGLPACCCPHLPGHRSHPHLSSLSLVLQPVHRHTLVLLPASRLPTNHLVVWLPPSPPRAVSTSAGPSAAYLYAPRYMMLFAVNRTGCYADVQTSVPPFVG